jgi:putative ABC transport system permease protein
MSQPLPPRLMSRLLDWWSGHADIEDLKGDLDEAFAEQVTHNGPFRARFSYTRQVLSICFSYALRRRKSSASYSPFYTQNSLSMFNNYFKIAIRNFLKHKLFTSINIVGLALGMSICLLALSISVSIFQTDSFHEKKDRIYQINSYISDVDNSRIYGSTYPAVASQLQEKYPFIEEVVKIKSGFRPEFDHHSNYLNFHGYYMDESFFDVFSFRLIQGNPHTALAEPFSLVLTKTVADKLYRNDNPLGKTLETDHGTYTVTGVMEDLKQTHFYFDVLTSYHTLEELQPGINLDDDWENYRNNYLYVLLKDNASQSSLTDALAQTSSLAEEFHPNQTIELQSIVLDAVVPRWDISNAIGIGWDYPSMLFFLFIGLLILLPAIFNYTNLSIARAIKRGKEIGVRKVIGAEKRQIKMQFIVETIVMTLFALIGAMVFFIPLQREFLNMVVAAEVLDTSFRPALFIVFILFGLIIGGITGFFPAAFFSRLNPVHTLKGSLQNRSVSVSGIKKGLFVFQFAMSLFFIIGVATIARQYRHVLSNNHGFESDQILTIPFDGMDKQVAINELQAHPDVKAITTSSNLPGILLTNSTEVTSNEIDTFQVNQVFVGDNFVENLKMKVVWGESGTNKKSSQNEELVLVNEQFLRSAAVFNTQKDSLLFSLEDGTKCRIVGILKDFNFEPLNQKITPLVMRYSLENSQYALLTVNSTDIKKTVTELDILWREIDQEAHFDAAFLDDEIEEAYHFLRSQIKIFSFLGALAIIISCLGLLGMVAYTTENRTKEIAIRKIMGASVSGIYLLLTKEFIRLIGFSALLAIPLSWVFYDKLFLYFLIRYGLGLGVWEIIFSVFFLFFIGFLFIYWQTSKVAQSNPATNLRYE